VHFTRSRRLDAQKRVTFETAIVILSSNTTPPVTSSNNDTQHISQYVVLSKINNTSYASSIVTTFIISASFISPLASRCEHPHQPIYHEIAYPFSEAEGKRIFQTNNEVKSFNS